MIDRAAALPPFAAGVNVTLMVQFAPVATEPPQLLVWAKSPLLMPVMAMLVMVSGPLPVFVSVTGFGGLVVETVCLPKFRLVVESVTAGTVTVCVTPAEMLALKFVSPA